LEEMAAKTPWVKGAALFVASGTMANLVSLLVHCGRGDEVIWVTDLTRFSTSKADVPASEEFIPVLSPINRTAHSVFVL